ncbi:MAG: site-specific DNA-methyltransferase [Leptolyngbya sp. PLA3]|nr:MAG: site-specific DNA-methyltransferase [Cyanobacteria bacterium CYA]MCE7969591.1 site-specific DNA-methyltransferase [Leptolyngbya sp. PL-A3]
MQSRNTMPPAITAITDSKFNALKAKLRELFELDKSDLDFGIYRIIAAKNKEVTEFLDRQLKDVVRATLAAHGAGAADQVQAELDKTIASLRAAEVPDEQIETNKKVADLRAKLAAAGGAASADLEADIYNHLLAFFGRYYDEGDFISQRRYKGDTYAIPYSGEEVTLHWANKDQYYIKSGEWHKDYRFKVGDKTVRFKLIEATQEVSNNKEADDAKRRYILAPENPVEESPGELTLRFEFRVPTQTDEARAADGAVSIFGGDYAKPSNPKKGDPREQFCADAEKRATAAMSAAWKQAVAAPGAAATDGKPLRTILGKHLDHFTARNTFDYFIHKDLGGFLRRELDFYIKNEVVRLDDLEALPGDHLQRVQGKVKAIRAVATRLIAFLGSLEDFQKKMWLKKKFVLNTNWLVTVDRIPPALRDVVAQNAEQWAEWERLGFKPNATADAGLFGGAAWGTMAYLDACDKLLVDTRHFDDAFRSSLLSAEPLSSESIETQTSGVLICGDNFHAVRSLGPTMRNACQCIYIDPPYNAQSSEILYKNTFKHSSWLAMMTDRLQAALPALGENGNLVVAIDEVEQERLGTLLRTLNPLRELTCVTVVHNATGQQGNNFSATHEYAYFVHGSREGCIGLEDRRDNPDVRPLRNVSKGSHLRTDAANCFYPILVKDGKVIGFGPVSADDYHPRGKNVQAADGVIEVYPINKLADGTLEERKWTFAQQTVGSIQGELSAVFNKDLKEWDIIRTKVRFNFKTVWTDKKYSANSWGSRILNEMLPDNEFTFPKSIYTVRDCIDAALANARAGDVLDFFAGSGTTGHSVVMLNREDGGKRRFHLVEMGRHFGEVLLPRVAKCLYCPDWSAGIAQIHDKGVSALVKYFALESYEDALNNLPAPSGTLLDGRTDAEKDALITYGLDLELGPHLLNLDAFRDPWGYTINAQLAGDAEIKRHRVDLVETFNYLIGLKVHAYGPLERYSADFERAAHADNLGRIKITGRLRRDANGPYVFQRVEGELNDGNRTRVLVVWRKLTDDPEKDAAVLDAWMARHRESTRERTEHRDYHLIYINGPVTLPQPTAEIRTVFPIEETFKIKMFEDTDSASQSGGANG